MIGGNFLLLCLLQFCLPKIMLGLEITSVTSDLIPLLETQNKIIDVLEETVRKKKKAFNFILTEIQRYKNEHQKAVLNPEHYFENPINTVTFMKRLTVDLDHIEFIIGQSTGYRKNLSLLVTPSRTDLDDAIFGMYRLQLVYKLNITQLVDGILNTTYREGGKPYWEKFLPMTTFDCYDIGQKMCQMKSLVHHGIGWLREAYRIFGRDKVILGLNKTKILLAIIKEYHRLNDHKNYIKWAEKLKYLRPKHIDLNELDVLMDLHRIKLGQQELKVNEQQRNNKQDNKRDMNKQPHKLKTKIKESPPLNPVEETDQCIPSLGLTKGYKLLCRGEVTVGNYIAKRLKCWYSRQNHYTQLAPIKTEQVYVKPDIFIFYNVIHDAEIEEIKEFVLPKMTLSKIRARRGAYQASSSNRLSKSYPVHDELELTEALTQRIADFTGLNASSAEPYHVNNYGVWGFYAQHVDYWTEPWMLQYLGQRLATVLLYMSDVVQGGATVFPVLGLTVYPVKGAALYWTNLLPSGDINNVTCHGSCPVLRGTKWAATKWINFLNQELARPCTTPFQSRKAKDVPHPERSIRL